MAELSQNVLQHLAGTVRSTCLVTSPFQHLELHDVFPPAFYGEIQANLPETRFYGELQHSDARLPNGRSARRKLELRPARLCHLPPKQREFWTGVARLLASTEVEAAYREKFADALASRLQKSLRDVKLHPAAMLLRDLGGYKISIHTDSFRKAITTQYYLPRDDSQAHLGTSFHAKKDGDFTKVRTMKFVPNCGYAFPVTDDSWHSVEQMRDSDGERNTIMLIYYLDQGIAGEFFNQAKQLTQDLLARFIPPSAD
jgi:hypothetical protein